MLKWVYLAILIFITLLYINVLIFLIQFHFLTCANISSMWSLLCSNCIRRKGYCPGQNQGTQRGWCHCRRVASKDWFYHVWNLQAAWNGRIEGRNSTVEVGKPLFGARGVIASNSLVEPRRWPLNKTTSASFSSSIVCGVHQDPFHELINKTFWSHGHDVLLGVIVDA